MLHIIYINDVSVETMSLVGYKLSYVCKVCVQVTTGNTEISV